MIAPEVPAVRPRALLAGVLLLVTSLGIGTGPAAAQPAADARATDDAPVVVHVRAITSAIGPGAPTGTVAGAASTVGPDTTGVGALTMRLVLDHRGADPLGGLEVVTAVHPGTRDRAVVRAAFDGTVTTSPLRVQRVAVAPEGSAPGTMRVVDVAVPTGGIAWPDTAAVHPVTVEVRDGRTVVGSLATAVVWLPDVPTAPLLTSVVVPIDDAPWRGPDGLQPSGVAGAVRDGGRLEDLLRGLEARPGAPVVLAPSAHLLEDLADRADGYLVVGDEGTAEALARGALPPAGPISRIDADDPSALRAADTLARLRALVGAAPVAPITGAYGDADLGALAGAEGSLADLAAEAAVEGPRRARRLLGVRVDPTTTLVAPVAPGELDLVAGPVVLLPNAAAPAVGQDGDALHRLRAPSGRAIAAVVAGADVSARLAAVPVPGDGGPVLAAHEVVVLTAVDHLAAPTTSDRTLLVLAPRDWDPGAVLVAELVARLTSAPWLEPVSPSALADRGRRAVQPLVLAGGAPSPLPDRLRETARTAWDEVTCALAAAPDGVTVDGRPIAALRDDLMRATSPWARTARPLVGQAQVDAVLAATSAVFGEVVLGTGAVTLTASEGAVPVTLRRTVGPALDVVVEVRGPAGLRWPEGTRLGPVRLEPGGDVTLAFPVTAVSTGRFPVTVRVLDPTGRREVASAVLPVRSTAAAGPALVGIAVVALGLVVVGTLRGRRRTDGPPADPDGPGHGLAAGGAGSA